MRKGQVDSLRERYPPGARLELIEMEGEPDMPPGLKGTVVHVDDIGQIQMNWDNGRLLALNPRLDTFFRAPKLEQTVNEMKLGGM